MFVETFALQADLMLDANTTQSSLPNAFGLIAAPFVPSPTLVQGDLVEASFPGYSGPTSFVYTNQFFDSALGWYIQISGIVFSCTGDPSPGQTIYGYFAIDQTGALMGTELFETPIQIVEAGQEISFVWRMPFARTNYVTPAIE